MCPRTNTTRTDTISNDHNVYTIHIDYYCIGHSNSGSS